MTMLKRVGSFNNEYFNSLIREYTDKGQRPESFGMSRAIMAYLDTNDSGAAEFMVWTASWRRWRRRALRNFSSATIPPALWRACITCWGMAGR